MYSMMQSTVLNSAEIWAIVVKKNIDKSLMVRVHRKMLLRVQNVQNGIRRSTANSQWMYPFGYTCR